MTPEEIDNELLECARYGEDDDLLLLLQHNANINHIDILGNTSLHRAAANNHEKCIRILAEYKAKYQQNNEGNTPCHWAAQNGSLQAFKALIELYPDIDMLEQNKAGRSIVTEAFASGNADLIEACLVHKTSTEERLLSGISNNTSNEKEPEDINEYNLKHAVQHTMQLNFSDSPSYDPKKLVHIRELPITRADNPFGTEEKPEDDTTGLGIWPASILLSRWIVDLGENVFKNKRVLELGAGCGLPGLATALYTNPEAVYISDIHDPTLDNSAFNLELNGEETQREKKIINDDNNDNDINNNGEEKEEEDVVIKEVLIGNNKTYTQIRKINWNDKNTYPKEPLDIIIGSDLIYDKNILKYLVPALLAMLKPDGFMLYAAPITGRDGMADLEAVLEKFGIICEEKINCPDKYYQNPLAKVSKANNNDNNKDNNKEEDLPADIEDDFILHFYDLSTKQPHTLYKFAYKK